MARCIHMVTYPRAVLDYHLGFTRSGIEESSGVFNTIVKSGEGNVMKIKRISF